MNNELDQQKQDFQDRIKIMEQDRLEENYQIEYKQSQMEI